MVPVRRDASDWITYVTCGGLVVAIFLGLASPSSALQPPVPSGADSNRPQQEIPTNHTAKAENDQSGTQKPLPVPKQTTAPISEQETAGNSKERKDKSSSDWWIVRFTGALVVVGAVQIVVFWIQAGRLKDTIKKMDEIATSQTTDMKASIAEAANAAKAMNRVANAMAVASQAAIDTARSSERSASVSEEHLRKIERPYLFIHEINMKYFEPAHAQIYISPDLIYRPFVKHSYANYGRTPAIIQAIWRKVEVGETMPDIPTFTQSCRAAGEFIVSIGKTEGTQPWAAEEPISGTQIIKITNGQIFMFFYGRIEYTDVIGSSYQTSFCFVLNAANHSVSTFGGEKYNHRT